MDEILKISPHYQLQSPNATSFQCKRLNSIDGELIVVLLTSDGEFITQQPVRVTVADAIFANLSPGPYTVIARHPSLDPTEARQDMYC